MNRGEIWLINLDPTTGAEIKKTRPAVIVNDNAVGILPLKVIVPITEWKDKYNDVPWMVRLEPDDINGGYISGSFLIRNTIHQKTWRPLGNKNARDIQGFDHSTKHILSYLSVLSEKRFESLTPAPFPKSAEIL